MKEVIEVSVIKVAEFHSVVDKNLRPKTFILFDTLDDNFGQKSEVSGRPCNPSYCEDRV